MSLPRQVEKILRTLTELPVDDFGPADWASLDAARDAARGEIERLDRRTAAKAAADAQRAARATPKKAKPYRQDPPELREAKVFVRNRSGGVCEANTPVCDHYARHVHHKARRKGKGSHAPELLLDVCPSCHDWIHDNVTEAYEREWLIHDFAVAKVSDTKGNR